MSRSFGSALTAVLALGLTATTNHINNPVYVARGKLEGSDLPVPIRRQRDPSKGQDDVWETFSDTDWLSTGWVQEDGSPLPEAPEGSFGWAFDAMRASPGKTFRPVGYKPGMVYFFDESVGNFRLRLPNGLAVRPAFPAREMRGQWEEVSAS